MATQPRDRQKAKHHMAVAPRQRPQFVNRANKTLMLEVVDQHLLVMPRRFGFYYGGNFFQYSIWGL